MRARTLAVPTALVGLALTVAGCAGTPEPARTIVVTQSTLVTEAAPAPAAPAAAAADDSAARTTAKTPATTPKKSSKKPAAAAPAAAAADDTFVMPDVVGQVLQDAQDLLQTKGSYFMDQRDASGLGRLQLIDSNWTVCRQSPKPGAKVVDTATVILWSVKLDETCP